MHICMYVVTFHHYSHHYLKQSPKTGLAFKHPIIQFDLFYY